MSSTLETLSSLLSKQYKEIPFREHHSIKSYMVDIDDLTINISVTMKRLQNDGSATNTGFTEKMFINDVNIVIAPPNPQIQQVVINHFKNQVKPNPWKGRNELIFEKVTVNDVPALI